jgi:hypothetical protein
VRKQREEREAQAAKAKTPAKRTRKVSA